MSTQETQKKNLKKWDFLHSVFPKNPTSREERELEDCGQSVHKNWRGACVENRCTRKHLQIETLENHHGVLLIAFSCVMQIQRWNTENDTSPEVLQRSEDLLMR